jgi:hypothetical protein
MKLSHEELLAALGALHVVAVEVEYAGSGDQGYMEEVRAYLTSGDKVELPEELASVLETWLIEDELECRHGGWQGHGDAHRVFHGLIHIQRGVELMEPLARGETRELTEDMLAWIHRQAPRVAFARVNFEGGHDSGGVTSIELLDSNKDEVGQLDSALAYRPSSWNQETRQYDVHPLSPERVLAHEAVAMLCQPVYDEYHGFAGEWSVEGFARWNLTNGQFLGLTGTMSVETYENFGDDDDGFEGW